MSFSPLPTQLPSTPSSSPSLTPLPRTLAFTGLVGRPLSICFSVCEVLGCLAPVDAHVRVPRCPVHLSTLCSHESYSVTFADRILRCYNKRIVPLRSEHVCVEHSFCTPLPLPFNPSLAPASSTICSNTPDVALQLCPLHHLAGVCSVDHSCISEKQNVRRRELEDGEEEETSPKKKRHIPCKPQDLRPFIDTVQYLNEKHHLADGNGSKKDVFLTCLRGLVSHILADEASSTLNLTPKEVQFIADGIFLLVQKRKEQGIVDVDIKQLLLRRMEGLIDYILGTRASPSLVLSSPELQTLSNSITPLVRRREGCREPLFNADNLLPRLISISENVISWDLGTDKEAGTRNKCFRCELYGRVCAHCRKDDKY
jgi:hypothetical protein